MKKNKMTDDDKVIKEVNEHYKKRVEETKHLTEEESLDLAFVLPPLVILVM